MTPLTPDVRDLLSRGEAGALVTVVEARGPMPRGLAARMLVTRDRIVGTIGGSRLEHDAMQEARRLLEDGRSLLVADVPRVPQRGECGGEATVLIEAVDDRTLDWLEPLEAGEPGVLLTPLHRPGRKLLLRRDETHELPKGLESAVTEALARRRPARIELKSGETWLLEPMESDLPRVVLFGAGHVGRALATALAPLPCRLRWIDSRAALLEEPAPQGVEVVLADDPLAQVRAAPAGAFFLVMTHSHDLDCEICEAVLRRGDFAFLGLIGSAAKRAALERRWRAHGVDEARIARVVCPIGLPGITGRQPSVIAASTTAQLLGAFEVKACATPCGPEAAIPA